MFGELLVDQLLVPVGLVGMCAHAINLFAISRYASAPGCVDAYFRMDLPERGASANRIDLRMGGSNTGMSYRRPTSARISFECWVRGSNIVAMIPLTLSCLFVRRLTSSIVSSSWP